MKGLSFKQIWEDLLVKLDVIFTIVTIVVTFGVVTYYYVTPATINDIPKISSYILRILVLLTISVFLRLRQIKKLLDGTKKAKVSEVFKFEEELSDLDLSKAKDIIITGIALERSLPELREELIECLNRGAKVNVIIIDSKDSLLEELNKKHTSGYSIESRRNQLEITKETVKLINDSTTRSGTRINIGYLPYLPSYALTILDPKSPTGLCRVKMFMHNTTKHPIFTITPQSDPELYTHFIKQYEQMSKCVGINS